MDVVREPEAGASAEEAMIILQGLLCLLREKNVLSRADIELLCEKVEQRVSSQTEAPLPCCAESAAAASSKMSRIASYIGQRYGGKHARHFS